MICWPVLLAVLLPELDADEALLALRPESLLGLDLGLSLALSLQVIGRFLFFFLMLRGFLPARVASGFFSKGARLLLLLGDG
jgi:hypothetical protein